MVILSSPTLVQSFIDRLISIEGDRFHISHFVFTLYPLSPFTGVGDSGIRLSSFRTLSRVSNCSKPEQKGRQQFLKPQLSFLSPRSSQIPTVGKNAAGPMGRKRGVNLMRSNDKNDSMIPNRDVVMKLENGMGREINFASLHFAQSLIDRISERVRKMERPGLPNSY